jgi:hypothetical protein
VQGRWGVHRFSGSLIQRVAQHAKVVLEVHRGLRHVWDERFGSGWVLWYGARLHSARLALDVGLFHGRVDLFPIPWVALTGRVGSR